MFPAAQGRTRRAVDETPRHLPKRQMMLSTATYRVLLVEDDPYVAAGIAALLGAEEYMVEVVSLGGRAEAAVERFSPDLVVLDVKLPDMSGTDVFRQLRARWRNLAIIFSSGHASNLDELGAAQAGRVRLLQKPYDGDALIGTIQELLASS